MFIFTPSSPEILQLFDMKIILVVAAGLIFGFPLYGAVTKKFGNFRFFKYLEALLLIVLFAAALSSSTMIFSDPFIYFRF